MKEVCAVIVTYNRCELLKECIESVRSQSFPCDLFVVDNASSDGTALFLESVGYPHISLDQNIGGAGGFNVGIRTAVSEGYRYIWLMDDDCIPEKDALKSLMDAAERLHDEFGFLSSKVLWTDGSLHAMNRIKTKEEDKIDEHLFRIRQATFVSLLLNSKAVEKCGLPIRDFFIWGDDIEYTRRIAVRNQITSYYAEDSVVVHKTKNNIGSKIAYDDIGNIGRYRYAYRNENYLYRQEGISGRIYYFLKCVYNVLRILLFSSDHKLKRLKTLFSAVREGFSFDPEVEYL